MISRDRVGVLTMSHISAYHALFAKNDKFAYGEDYNSRYKFKRFDIATLAKIHNELPGRLHRIVDVVIVAG